MQIFNLSRLDSLPRPMGKGPNDECPTHGDISRIDSYSVIESIGSSHNIVAFQEEEKVLVVRLEQILLSAQFVRFGQLIQ